MDKWILVLSVMFTLLTFAGAFYVIGSGGSENAGYAAIPMVFAVSLIALYRKSHK